MAIHSHDSPPTLCHTIKSKEGCHGRDERHNTVNTYKSATSAAFLLLPGLSEADSNKFELLTVQDVCLRDDLTSVWLKQSRLPSNDVLR